MDFFCYVMFRLRILRNLSQLKQEVVAFKKLMWLAVVLAQEEVNQVEKLCRCYRRRRSYRRSNVSKSVVSFGRHKFNSPFLHNVHSLHHIFH